MLLNKFQNVLGVFHLDRSVKARPSRCSDDRSIATLDRFDRVEFYPDDLDDRVNFEAIMWKPLR